MSRREVRIAILALLALLVILASVFASPGTDSPSEPCPLVPPERARECLEEAIAELKDDMRGLRTTIVAFAFTIAGSAVMIAATLVLTKH